MQAADLAVDRIQAGGGAGQIAARLQRALDQADRLGRRGQKVGRLPALTLAFGHLVERAFGILDLLLGIDTLTGVERIFDQMSSDRDQFAQQRQIIDLLGKIARADQADIAFGQAHQIAGAAHFLQRLILFEKGFQRNRGDHHIAIEQFEYLAVDAAMQRLEKMMRLQLGLHIFGHAIVEQQRAQQRGLCLNIVRQAGGPVPAIAIQCPVAHQSDCLCHPSLMNHPRHG